MANKCKSYHIQPTLRYTYHPFTGQPIAHDVEVGVCWGTKETDECSCGGDRTKCDFYPEVREKAFKEQEPKFGEWISVEERLPECENGVETGALLFRLWTGTVIAGYFGRGGIWRDKYFRHYWDDKEGWDASDVSHWMPLPPPPKD